MPPDRPLNILHVFRAPVGGLFRHVLDLAWGQIQRGHRVGLIADSHTGGQRADDALAEIAPRLALGLTRLSMQRHPGPGDLLGVILLNRHIRDGRVDIAHGHGAKGGAFARLAFPARSPLRVYTPHGGSLWFEPNTLGGKIYLTTEKLLMRRRSLYIFESAFSAKTFGRKIGQPRGPVRIIHNGVAPSEFEPIAAAPDATDLVFLGEFRELKGIDILIEALAQLRAAGRTVTATLIGDGPDSAALHALVARHGLEGNVRFMPPMPARRALTCGRTMVVPSRRESLPYVVLEAAAAAKPLIANRIGGIPEIYGPLGDDLVPPEDPAALAKAIATSLDNQAAGALLAEKLRERIREDFTVDRMVDAVLGAYRSGLAGRR